MKATLTIKVPDNFNKGDCLTCQYADNFFGGCKVKSLIKNLGSLDCPLEIQDNTKEFSEREVELMKQGKVISHRPKGNNQ